MNLEPINNDIQIMVGSVWWARTNIYWYGELLLHAYDKVLVKNVTQNMVSFIFNNSNDVWVMDCDEFISMCELALL